MRLRLGQWIPAFLLVVLTALGADAGVTSAGVGRAGAPESVAGARSGGGRTANVARPGRRGASRTRVAPVHRFRPTIIVRTHAMPGAWSDDDQLTVTSAAGSFIDTAPASPPRRTVPHDPTAPRGPPPRRLLRS
jgi:hypothetical protein